jgi:DNA-binding response OmpR family regulator
MSLPRGRILVVEDAEEMRNLLVAILEGEGYSVAACATAEQAFALARADPFDLIITDLMLGASSGLDLIVRVRSDLKPPVPPIVVCSAFAGFEKEALLRGATTFIPKPFETSQVRRTVTAMLARRKIEDQERAEAQAYARTLRAESAAAARVALRHLRHVADWGARARATVEFLPRYFGFGASFAVLLQGEELRILASSDEAVWPLGQALAVPLCRDIMETSSALVVPDLETIGTAALAPNGQPLRFFTGVPLLSGPIGVGALCFVDDRAHGFGAEDYSLLETFGRRASAVLSGHDVHAAPLWRSSGLLTREGLSVVLTAELARMQARPLSLALFVFVGRAPTVATFARTALADLGDRRYAALVAREDKGEARRAIHALVEAIAHANGFAARGLVMVEEGAAASFDARSILHAAECLLQSDAQTASGAIDEIVIRRELHPIHALETAVP